MDMIFSVHLRTLTLHACSYACLAGALPFREENSQVSLDQRMASRVPEYSWLDVSISDNCMSTHQLSNSLTEL
jgi:hypothetical protein